MQSDKNVSTMEKLVHRVVGLCFNCINSEEPMEAYSRSSGFFYRLKIHTNAKHNDFTTFYIIAVSVFYNVNVFYGAVVSKLLLEFVFGYWMVFIVQYEYSRIFRLVDVVLIILHFRTIQQNVLAVKKKKKETRK